ncbi:MAG: NAD-dependent epimerase/dehydratase family protein [Bacteroidetes bacterium]|nr:MAG: NAD-dependent epimerase/dehydratase family protein [Bacteroidota bacterium]
MKHTILGAGGSIGNALAYKLLENGEDVRLVSRSMYSITGAESVKADITSYHETLESIKQSDIVYLCVGLPYDTKIWKDTWPKIMKNTIDACKNIGAKLIFFDNVYMYGNVDGKMVETTPYNPCSKKGEIRAEIATLLENEIAQKNVNAIIARAADLYGPFATQTSLPYLMVIEKLMQGKNAQWMVDVNQPHSYTYTIDCANGLYLLANNNDTFNQVWHLPTYSPAIDGKAFINLSAKEIGVAPEYSVLPKLMIKMAGLFNKKISEAYEMLYQSEYEYHFDSSKFNKHFNYSPKSYIEGISETIKFLKSK